MALTRLLTGIDGVDEILHGGLMKAGAYLVRGAPGAGKTVFANQICFHRAANGGKAGYVTLLVESTGRMLDHMAEFSFFRAEVVPSSISYVSAFAALKAHGLPGVTAPLASEIRSRKVDLPMRAFGERGEHFLATLTNELRRLDTTTLVSVESDDGHGTGVPLNSLRISAIADNVVRLRIQEKEWHTRRLVSMGKVRGSRLDLSLRELALSDTGLLVVPDARDTANVSRDQPHGKSPDR